MARSKTHPAQWKPGQSGNPAGRRAGNPNRVTADVREAYAMLLQGNIKKLQGWLDRIAAKHPERAFDIILRMTEFVVPKQRAVSGTISFDILSEEDLDRIICELLKCSNSKNYES